MKRALISGIPGQDGSYLAELRFEGLVRIMVDADIAEIQARTGAGFSTERSAAAGAGA